MSLVRSIDSPAQLNPRTGSSGSILPMKTVGLMIGGAILLGVLGGWVAGHNKSAGDSAKTTINASGDEIAQTAGIADKETFKDIAEGTLKEGGIEGEGSYHLERPGGASQFVYLTSSTVDLSEYIGKKVKVHGVTIAGQKAGWLMDVGFVELQ